MVKNMVLKLGLDQVDVKKHDFKNWTRLTVG